LVNSSTHRSDPCVLYVGYRLSTVCILRHIGHFVKKKNCGPNTVKTKASHSPVYEVCFTVMCLLILQYLSNEIITYEISLLRTHFQ